MLDADRVVQDGGDRRQAVGRAGGVGDDDVVPADLVVVDAVDDRQVGSVGGRRDEHPLRSGRDVRHRLFLGGEDAGALQHDVDLQLLVRQLGRIALRGDADRPAARIDRVAVDLHLVREAPMHGIVAQQMRIGLHRAEIVDAHDLDVGPA